MTVSHQVIQALYAALLNNEPEELQSMLSSLSLSDIEYLSDRKLLSDMIAQSVEFELNDCLNVLTALKAETINLQSSLQIALKFNITASLTSLSEHFENDFEEQAVRQIQYYADDVGGAFHHLIPFLSRDAIHTLLRERSVVNKILANYYLNDDLTAIFDLVLDAVLHLESIDISPDIIKLLFDYEPYVNTDVFISGACQLMTYIEPHLNGQAIKALSTEILKRKFWKVIAGETKLSQLDCFTLLSHLIRKKKSADLQQCIAEEFSRFVRNNIHTINETTIASFEELILTAANPVPLFRMVQTFILKIRIIDGTISPTIFSQIMNCAARNLNKIQGIQRYTTRRDMLNEAINFIKILITLSANHSEMMRGYDAALMIIKYFKFSPHEIIYQDIGPSCKLTSNASDKLFSMAEMLITNSDKFPFALLGCSMLPIDLSINSHLSDDEIFRTVLAKNHTLTDILSAAQRHEQKGMASWCLGQLDNKE